MEHVDHRCVVDLDDNVHTLELVRLHRDSLNVCVHEGLERRLRWLEAAEAAIRTGSDSSSIASPSRS